MNNHFGKGLMAGLKATHADSAVNKRIGKIEHANGGKIGRAHV